MTEGSSSASSSSSSWTLNPPPSLPEVKSVSGGGWQTDYINQHATAEERAILDGTDLPSLVPLSWDEISCITKEGGDSDTEGSQYTISDSEIPGESEGKRKRARRGKRSGAAKSKKNKRLHKREKEVRKFNKDFRNKYVPHAAQLEALRQQSASGAASSTEVMSPKATEE